MATTSDNARQEQAVLFLQKIASKLPVQSTSESTIIGLFEGIVESIEKSTVKTTILANLDFFFGTFEVAIKKQIEKIQASSPARKGSKSGLLKIAKAQFPISKARVLLGSIDANFIQYDHFENKNNNENKEKNEKNDVNEDKDEIIQSNKVLNILISIQCNQYSASQMVAILLKAENVPQNVLQYCSASDSLSKAFLTRYVRAQAITIFIIVIYYLLNFLCLI